jgi:hypothetical protein
VTARKGANLPQRRCAAGARSKAIFRKNFACSSPTPNTTQAATHFSVTAGRTALGTIEQVEGGFVATGVGGTVVGEFSTLREAAASLPDGGER